jgi:N-acetylglucosaminyl-diphospho-decaprenol L-rhamnosyltransferase
VPAAEAEPFVDVCVLSYDAGPLIERCLRSTALIPGARVLLREHGTSTATLDRAAASAGEIPLMISHDPANPGFAAGMNALARQATAPWVLFLNPDAEVLDWPWDATRRPTAGTVVGALQIDSTGREVPAYGRQMRVRDEIARSWLRRFAEPVPGAGFVGGAGLLMERRAFDGLGGFDERYFLFYEDIDLCLRATASRMHVVLDRSFRIRHDTGSSTRRRWDAALGHSYRSGRIFHAAHGHPRRAYDVFVAADAAARAAMWTMRRQTSRRDAYARLARRAAAAALQRDLDPSAASTGWPGSAP